MFLSEFVFNFHPNTNTYFLYVIGQPVPESAQLIARPPLSNKVQSQGHHHGVGRKEKKSVLACLGGQIS